MERMSAYSKIALKIMKMQVIMNLSMALSLLEAEDGALDRTLLKTLMMGHR